MLDQHDPVPADDAEEGHEPDQRRHAQPLGQGERRHDAAHHAERDARHHHAASSAEPKAAHRKTKIDDEHHGGHQQRGARSRWPARPPARPAPSARRAGARRVASQPRSGRPPPLSCAALGVGGDRDHPPAAFVDDGRRLRARPHLDRRRERERAAAPVQHRQIARARRATHPARRPRPPAPRTRSRCARRRPPSLAAARPPPAPLPRDRAPPPRARPRASRRSVVGTSVRAPAPTDSMPGVASRQRHHVARRTLERVEIGTAQARTAMGARSPERSSLMRSPRKPSTP